jgi:uncharacterized membrane protein YhaH (DUF805 family)
MSFGQSIQTCFSKYATWNGRAGRAEYWWFVLFLVILDIVAFILDASIHTFIIGLLIWLAVLLPSLAVLVRRLHDTGRSGWWWWIGLVPLVGWIILLIFTIETSGGPNNYGVGPEGPSGAGAVSA